MPLFPAPTAQVPELREDVHVLSVDSVQGSEADVAIISTVRSKTDKPSVGSFMMDRRRVNVALSRAKQLSVIVGNAETLASKGGPQWRAIVDDYASPAPVRAPAENPLAAALTEALRGLSAGGKPGPSR